MKRITKVLAIILVLALLAPSVAAATVDPVVPTSSAYLASYSAYMSFSGTTVKAHFRVTGMSVLAEIGAKEVIIQESTDGVNWTDIATFNYADPGNDEMLATGKQIYTSYVSCTGTSGNYYRCYVTIWGGDGTNGDARYIYSTAKQL